MRIKLKKDPLYRRLEDQVSNQLFRVLHDQLKDQTELQALRRNNWPLKGPLYRRLSRQMLWPIQIQWNRII